MPCAKFSARYMPVIRFSPFNFQSRQNAPDATQYEEAAPHLWRRPDTSLGKSAAEFPRFGAYLALCFVSSSTATVLLPTVNADRKVPSTATWAPLRGTPPVPV